MSRTRQRHVTRTSYTHRLLSNASQRASERMAKDDKRDSPLLEVSETLSGLSVSENRVPGSARLNGLLCESKTMSAFRSLTTRTRLPCPCAVPARQSYRERGQRRLTTLLGSDERIGSGDLVDEEVLAVLGGALLGHSSQATNQSHASEIAGGSGSRGEGL
jgi:hypothetical protein